MTVLAGGTPSDAVVVAPVLPLAAAALAAAALARLRPAFETSRHARPAPRFAIRRMP